MTKGLTGHSVVSLIKDTKPIHEGFPDGSVVKNPPANQETGSLSGSGRAPGVGSGNPLQYSCLENPTWRSLVGYNPQGCKESDTTEQLHLP